MKTPTPPSRSPDPDATRLDRLPAAEAPEGAGPTLERAPGFAPDEVGRMPELPGVYIMRDAQGAVLYVGKAANLQARVRSYTSRSGDGRLQVRFLMRRVARIETIVTANELEALLLENTLIKRLQPRYNIRLRDDKTYVSVRVNLDHEWPRAVVVRRRPHREGPPRRDGSVYLGPFASAASVRQTLRQLQKIFPIRSCPDAVLANRSRPCLLYEIGRCCAPCVKPVDRDAYREMVEGTILFLKGRTQEVVRMLRERMERHSAAMEYEQAALIRDRLLAIERTTERQGVQRHQGSDLDVVALAQAGGYGALVVFVHRGGLLVSSRPYVVRDHGQEAPELMEEFLTRYYEAESPPAELLLSVEPSSPDVLERWLGERRGGRVRLHVPQRGENLRLMETARENARRVLEQHLGGRRTWEAIGADLQRAFRLPAPPETIECYDISTLQGFATVGSLVVFRGGEPDPNRYRRFLIKSLAGQDDFGALREVLRRRLRRVAAGEEPRPGLMVIDGGKGQLAVARAALEEAGLADVPLVAMAKARSEPGGDSRERARDRFFLPGRKNPLFLERDSPALYLLQRLRDEAHRFAIDYHRRLRERRNLRSALEAMPGIGPQRAARLLRHFGSLRRLREAAVEEIAAVPGIPADLAARLVEWLRAEAESPPSPAPTPE